jgi:Holliday junction resolvase RusA-like endonuclease
VSELRVVVPGKPVPKARPRFDPRSGRTYTAKKTVQYERHVKGEAWAATRRAQWPRPDDCARVAARLKLRAPGSKLPRCTCAFCATEYRVAVLVVLPDRRTRDLDNVTKSILDACNGVLWYDDRQVVGVSMERAINPSRPRVELVVSVAVAQGELDVARADVCTGGSS